MTRCQACCRVRVCVCMCVAACLRAYLCPLHVCVCAFVCHCRLRVAVMRRMTFESTQHRRRACQYDCTALYSDHCLFRIDARIRIHTIHQLVSCQECYTSVKKGGMCVPTLGACSTVTQVQVTGSQGAAQALATTAAVRSTVPISSVSVRWKSGREARPPLLGRTGGHPVLTVPSSSEPPQPASSAACSSVWPW